jgi:uncharacterized protein YdeI (YjbR/CyaY-like superfamily)
MAADLPILDPRTRRRWRAWLAGHCASSPGVWLVFYKERSGMPSLPYEDAVREALCFGWVDSLIKRLDDDRYARKFTPRKPTSAWSDSNRARWAQLQAAGLLAAPGRAAAPSSKRAAPPPIPKLPAYVVQALKGHAGAWRNFERLPPSEKRRFVAWIHMAKRPDTRERRMRESVALLAAGRTLGLR